MNVLLVGTRNEGKIRELHKLLSDSPVEVKGLDSFPGTSEVIEDRGTLPGNAKKKAQTFHEETDLPTVSDDSGLEVDHLNGRPGVKTARFAGENATTSENISLLLQHLRGVSNRSAQFRTVLAFVDSNGKLWTFEGKIEGEITEERRGTKGFGYDPVFVPEGYDKTFSEMDQSLKNKISHRRRALEKFQSFLLNK